MTKSLRQRLAEIFGFDLRSLALFRIALALVVLVDLSVRFSQVTAHYSELGVLPLGSLSKVSASPFYWSIFALSDSVLVQSILFIVAIAMALLLLKVIVSVNGIWKYSIEVAKFLLLYPRSILPRPDNQ